MPPFTGAPRGASIRGVDSTSFVDHLEFFWDFVWRFTEDCYQVISITRQERNVTHGITHDENREAVTASKYANAQARCIGRKTVEQVRLAYKILTNQRATARPAIYREPGPARSLPAR
jgi:hypothetical protein